MNRIDYILSKPGATEDYPFGSDVAVFRVKNKMFALAMPPDKPTSLNLKCEPTLAVMLRQKYKGVEPGYHMNKTHWNTVRLNSDVPEDEIKRQIDHSYELIVGKKKAPRR
jgi:predicted DNA-binding protein (MmcQ/YjbR family)